MDKDDRVASLDELPEMADFMMRTIKESYMQAKVEVTRNGPQDLEPRIMYMPITLDSMMGIVPVLPPGVDPPTGLGLALLAARQKFGAPAMVMFMSEAYMKIFDSEDRTAFEAEMEHHQRGDWVNDPTASECLTIHLAHLMPDGITVRYLFTNIPFRYEDGSVTFGDIHYVDSEDKDAELGEGVMSDVIFAAFSAASN